MPKELSLADMVPICETCDTVMGKLKSGNEYPWVCFRCHQPIVPAGMKADPLWLAAFYAQHRGD